MANSKWFKGNIHTHTTNSDGDETPENVVKWYRQHGYDFLVLSDHNHLTLFNYAKNKRKFKRPMMIPGEEVTLSINQGQTGIHINAIGISTLVEPIDAGGIVPTIQANVNSIIEAGGLASLNHPNYMWSYNHEHISQVNGATMLEIFNGHPAVNVHGAPGRPSYEEIWDKVLSNGKPIFGVATDDSHNYKDFSPELSNPGRGWIMVQADQLSYEGIMSALAQGSFYASTGVELSEYQSHPELISLGIKQERDYIYTTTFIGNNGTELASSTSPSPSYQPKGDEKYVRSVVQSSSGTKAWTQPLFIN